MAQWRRPTGHGHFPLCIGIESTSQIRGRWDTWETGKIIVVGDLPGLLDATRRLALEPQPPDRDYHLGSVWVLDVMGDRSDSMAARLVANAVSSILLRPHDREDRRLAIYARELEPIIAAYPSAGRTMELAQAAISGVPLAYNDLMFLDAALSDTVIRRLCAEWELDTRLLAAALKRDGVPDVDAMHAEWSRAVFSSGLTPGSPEPLWLDGGELRRLHRAVRQAVGEDPTERPTIPHNTGGCAAFAAVLNSVIGGPGRYVVTGRPVTGLCGHVALRVGDFVVDGEGVSEPDAFLRRWRATIGPLDIHDPSPDGSSVRRLAGGDRDMDEGVLERALREELQAAGLIASEVPMPAF